MLGEGLRLPNTGPLQRDLRVLKDNGKEHGSYYSILGLYGDNGSYCNILGVYESEDLWVCVKLCWEL